MFIVESLHNKKLVLEVSGILLYFTFERPLSPMYIL